MSFNLSQPIFIMGCDRSGTTMLASMIGSAESVVVTPESHFKNYILKSQPEKKQEKIEEKIDRLLNDRRFRVWLENEHFRKKISKKYLKTMDGKTLLNYLVRLYHGALDKKITWMDHTPANTFIADLLIANYPDARFIHIIRDGRAVASSVIPLQWGPNTFEHAAWWWTQRVACAMAAEIKYESSMLRLYFEDVVKYPQDTLKKVCSFLNIDFSERMLEGNGFNVPDYTKGQHTLVNTRPAASKAELPYYFLCSRGAEVFESIAGDLLRYLGYTTVFDTPRPFNKIERLTNRSLDYWRNIRNRKEQRRRDARLPSLEGK